MLEKIRFQASVPGDLDSLLELYESYSVATARRLRDSLNRMFQLIEENPKMYAVDYDNIRSVKIKRNPILVKYKIVAGIPVVLTVFHSKSRPNA